MNVSVIVISFIAILAACFSALAFENDHCPCEDSVLEPEPINTRSFASDMHPTLCIFFDTLYLHDNEHITLISEAREILSNANETMPLDLHFLVDPLDKTSLKKRAEINLEKESGNLCHVIMRVVTAAEYERSRASRELCPGLCYSIPQIIAPITWLLASTISPQLLRNAEKFVEGGVVSKDKGAALHAAHGTQGAQLSRDDAFLTCSLSVQQYLHNHLISQHDTAMSSSTQSFQQQQRLPTSLSYLLMVLYWRRVMECREQKYWRNGYDSFIKKLEEYIAVESQYNNHNLMRPTRGRRLQTEGMTLEQWENQRQHKRVGSIGNRKIATAKGVAELPAQKSVNSEDNGDIRVTGSSATTTGGRRHKSRTALKKSIYSSNPHRLLGGRRRVQAIVIWIGSNASLALMHEQARMLEGQPHIGHNAVVGWAADDLTYACQDSATRCWDPRGVSRFKVLPSSAINYMKKGWGCAQRRPLRVLAHTLLLYDPTFVVLVDDDTFVNFPMLMQRWSTYLLDTMVKEPIVLGERMGKWGERGHLSKKGLFAGGSGYILGKALLAQLVAHEVWALGGLGIERGPDSVALAKDQAFYGDAYRSSLQMSALSVLADAVGQSNRKCPKSEVYETEQKNMVFGSSNTGDMCISSLLPKRRKSVLHGQKHSVSASTTVAETGLLQPKNWYWPSSSLLDMPSKAKDSLNAYPFDSMVVPINTRLIDLCSALMSNEGTCQHSDHAMGRCLLYGASGIPVGAVCETQVPLHTVPKIDPLTGEAVMIGMCFAARECDLDTMITCHRFKPNTNSAFANKQLSKDKVEPLFLKGGKDLALYLAGVPMKLQSKQSYYKVFSSFWNGTHSDTNTLP